jgi:protein SCO1/2
MSSAVRACWAVVAALAAGLAAVPCALAADGVDHHAHHHVVPETQRSLRSYTVPAVSLVRDDGTGVSLASELADARPVVLNFIYTTCTSVCPLTSQTFSELQRKLGAARDAVHLVSISIDPEYDTPERLTAYANKYHAGAQWQHYTGTTKASIALQQAFNAYRGDKMNHIPLTFLRAAPGKPWVRLDGFADPNEVVDEFRKLASSK